MAAITAKEFKTMERGKSDFYSWQIYRWLKKFPHHARIYRQGGSVSNKLFIGTLQADGWLIGANLRYICHAGRRLECFAYVPSVNRDCDLEDVTDWFWSEYRKIGVCAIHGDFAHKWMIGHDGNRRCCDHCGKVERRTFEVIKKTVEVWS